MKSTVLFPSLLSFSPVFAHLDGEKKLFSITYDLVTDELGSRENTEYVIARDAFDAFSGLESFYGEDFHGESLLADRGGVLVSGIKFTPDEIRVDGQFYDTGGLTRENLLIKVCDPCDVVLTVVDLRIQDILEAGANSIGEYVADLLKKRATDILLPMPDENALAVSTKLRELAASLR